MSAFKSCPSCGETWASRKIFTSDPEILLVGYQSSYTVKEPGLFLFNHACGSTIAVDAADFEDMYDEDICQSCDAHCESESSLCSRSMTGEDTPDRCVCKFSQTIECKLADVMSQRSTGGG